MKIAVIGNLHDLLSNEAFGFDEKDRQSFYETFMERFFSIPADLYVSIGDLTNINSIDELKNIHSIIQQHQKQFVHVLGKHGIPGASRREILNIIRQDRFHMKSADHAVMAFLDTTLAQNYGDSAGTLDLVQQHWLETVMVESGSRPLIVFGHHPVHITSKCSEKEKHCIPPVTPLMDLLDNKQGAGLYVNGHHSTNSIALKDQWTFLQLASIFDEQAVRIIEASDSLVTTDYVPFILPVKKAKGHTIGKANVLRQLDPHPLGKEIDVKYAIPLAASEQSDNSLDVSEKKKINSFKGGEQHARR